ncbi:MAG: DUF3365 domain-containing protein [Synechococcales cyanobacterium RM1_1_8]|nr:DUF3365 domain-containing protein [Synechococcales cyanobacterium RM1_1_8]
MIRVWIRCLLSVCLAAVLLLGSPAIAQANPDSGVLAKAVQSIEELDSMRSGLASYLETDPEQPTAETMKKVCKPVGMKAQQLSQENGWQVKQISNKYRNPAHAPDGPASRKALARFERDAELMGFWQAETLGEQAGTRYYRRIDVEASCLACHGGRAGRPEFVKNNYPEDLAYNFKEGDLRGMYSVFMPEMQAALQDALTQS